MEAKTHVGRQHCLKTANDRRICPNIRALAWITIAKDHPLAFGCYRKSMECIDRATKIIREGSERIDSDAWLALLLASRAKGNGIGLYTAVNKVWTKFNDMCRLRYSSWDTNN